MYIGAQKTLTSFTSRCRYFLFLRLTTLFTKSLKNNQSMESCTKYDSIKRHITTISILYLHLIPLSLKFNVEELSCSLKKSQSRQCNESDCLSRAAQTKSVLPRISEHIFIKTGIHKRGKWSRISDRRLL